MASQKKVPKPRFHVNIHERFQKKIIFFWKKIYKKKDVFDREKWGLKKNRLRRKKKLASKKIWLPKKKVPIPRFHVNTHERFQKKNIFFWKKIYKKKTFLIGKSGV